MSVLGWATCELCRARVNAVVWWPSASDARKQLCQECYAKLKAATPPLQRLGIGESAACPYKVASARPSQATVKHYLIPAGCEMRFLFTLWRLHRGLREPLRDRVVRPNEAAC